MKHLLLLPLLCLLLAPLAAQRTVRCLVLNHSYDPPRPEKFVKLTPLSGGNTVEQGSDAGIFELRLGGIPVGKPIELIVSKDGYQVLGPNPTIFTYAMPADESDVVRIAIIKSSDFDSRKADYEKAIEKRIKQANAVLLDSIARLQGQALSEDERAGLTKFIGQQNREIEELRKNKDELAARLAQVDLDQASEFARLALQKFRVEGDLKAALALMPEEKLVAFWENMLSQEEKVRRARQQGVENYMIRARLLAADFQFPAAYKNYLEAVEKDSLNIDNLWEVAYFLSAQNQQHRAIKLYEKALTLAKTDSERSALLNNLGGLYRANQNMPEAEKAYHEALSIRRKLADKNPDAFLPDVAMTLNNLGVFYRDNQQMPEAEKAYNEALRIFRKLTGKNNDAFLPNVATTLNNLGNYYLANQKMPEAETAYHEALRIYRNLADKNPDAFLLDVAMTLNNLGNYYSDNQKMPEAEKAYNEALRIYRNLADKNPDAFLPNVATTLNNLGEYFRLNNKFLEAEKVYHEALSIQRKLADKNPDAFLLDVAMTLNNLGNYYSDNQKMPEAENAYHETLRICRRLAEKNPDAFLPNVAAILNNLGIFYSDNQKMPEAEKAYHEALSIRRKLADKNPDAFLPDVAATLNNLGALYNDIKKMPETEKAYQEALSIRRKLADKNPDAFLPDVAATLNNLGGFYYAYQKMPETEKAYNEALSIRRKLADKNPDAFLPDVAMTLHNLGEYYRVYNKFPDAEKAINEALSIQRKLADKNPDAFLPDVAMSLNNLGNYYHANQKNPEAENAYNEALHICRNLADKNPDAFLPYVASTLNSFGVLYGTWKNYPKALEHYSEALHLRQTAIQNGQAHFIQNWVRVLGNIAEVRDSTEAKKDFVNCAWAGRLLAESCDSLQHLDTQLKNYAVQQYGNLSWWALFARDYPLAERAARRCLELDPSQLSVYTNLGHSYLLRDDLKKAKEAYRPLQGKTNGSGKPYKQVLEEDLQALEAEGITHRGMAEIREWLGREW